MQSAGSPSEDKRLSELRVVIPDASDEELRQMLRDDSASRIPELATPAAGPVVISYGNLGWERLYADAKFRWKRSDMGGARTSSFGDDRAYVRTVELVSTGRVRSIGTPSGRVSLIAADMSEVDAIIKRGHDGSIMTTGGAILSSQFSTILSYKDILSARKMNLSDKIEWFHDMSSKICQRDVPMSVDVRGSGILLNGIMGKVLSFSRRDLRRSWSIYGEAGEISTHELYEVIMSHEELGLWQRSTTDQRMQINFLSGE